MSQPEEVQPFLGASPISAAEKWSRSEDPRVPRAVEEYLAAQRNGRRPERQEFLARHAEIASALADCLDGLEFIQAAAPQLRESAREAPEQAATEAGDVNPEGPLGDFRLVREVGRGGMGVVYEAIQISLGRRVALKVLPLAAALDAKQLQRFKNEAQAAAHLHHQNIVPVYGVGCERGVHYYAMQFIDGRTLAAMIAELRRLQGIGDVDVPPSTICANAVANGETVATPVAALSTERSSCGPAHFRAAATLGVQAAQALEYAHQMGVVHRDIKPANLLVDGRGSLWVTDFGLAHCQSFCGLTMTGDLIGTLRYMSPEQALAQRVVIDHRTDIYSLGVTLYELLTLVPPFDGPDRQKLLQQLAFEEPKSPRRLNQAIPVELETIVLKSMEKNPVDRYATAQELADDLRRYLEHKPIQARRPSVLVRLRKWSYRHRGAVSAAVASALLVLAATSGIIALKWREAEKAGGEASKQGHIARAMNQFFVKDLLGAASPYEAQGRKITVEEVLDKAAVRIETAFPGQPEVEAGVRMAIASAYNSLGLNDKAEPHLQRALTIREQLLGLENEDTLETLVEIGATWIMQGKYAEGEQLYRQTLDTVRRALGEDHLLALNLEHLIGCAVANQRSWDEAESLLKQSLRHKTQIIGEDDPDTLETMENLALLLGERLSKWQEAEPLARKCLEIWERRHRENHPRTLDAQKTLASILMTKGRWKEAEILIRETLQRARAVSPKHDRTAALEHNLALVLFILDRLDEAEAGFRNSVQLRSNPEHPEALHSRIYLAEVLLFRGKLTAAEQQLRELLVVNGRLHENADFLEPIIRAGLGWVFWEQGKWAQAEEIQQQALTGLRRTVPGHFLTLHTASNLAVLLDAIGKHAEAGTLFRETLQTWRNSLPPDHPELALTLSDWGEHLLAEGDSRQAEAALTEALRIERAALPLEHRRIGQTLCSLGWLRTQTGHPQEGRQLLNEGLAICRRAWPANHWIPANAENRLGGCLTVLGQRADAERMLLSSYQNLQEAPGTPPQRRGEAVNRIIELYESWGKGDKAKEWRNKGLTQSMPGT
jgi:serine/threonine protein kinase